MTSNDESVMRVVRVIAVVLVVGVFALLYVFANGAKADEPIDYTKRSYNNSVIMGDVLSTCKHKEQILLFLELKMARDPDPVPKMQKTYKNPEKPDCYNAPTFGRVMETQYFGSDVDSQGKRLHLYVLTVVGMFMPEVTYVYSFVYENEVESETGA